MSEKVPQLSPADVEDLLLGCGVPGGEQGFNLARVVAVGLGLDDVPGTTVTRYCTSSLQSKAGRDGHGRELVRCQLRLRSGRGHGRREGSSLGDGRDQRGRCRTVIPCQREFGIDIDRGAAAAST